MEKECDQQKRSFIFKRAANYVEYMKPIVSIVKVRCVGIFQYFVVDFKF